MTVIAHEVGHLYCHHLDQPSSSRLEIEADRFAGAALRLAGYPLKEALAVVPILDERPSRSHPARAARVEALTLGWNQPERAKDCRKQ